LNSESRKKLDWKTGERRNIFFSTRLTFLERYKQSRAPIASYIYTVANKSRCKISYKIGVKVVKIQFANPRQNLTLVHENKHSQERALGVSAC
jgi:hypothetical protein